MKRVFRFTCLCSVAVLCWAGTNAHHAISANYSEEIGTVEGVVVEVFWANPHVHYYIEVTSGDGATRLWDLEGSNLNVMRQAGWSRDTITIGDRVRVSGQLGLQDRPRLLMERASLEILNQTR